MLDNFPSDERDVTATKARRDKAALLQRQLVVDLVDHLGGLGRGAAGNGALHRPFDRGRPAEIPDVPLSVRQHGGIDRRNAFDIERVHGEPRFGVTDDAIGVEEVASLRIGDQFENVRFVGNVWIGEDRRYRPWKIRSDPRQASRA